MIGTKNAYHLLILVDGFVLLLAEGVKSLYSNITVILSQFQYFAVFAVIFDEFINKIIAKSNIGSILCSIAIINFFDICPDNGGQTHWARIAGCV